MKLGRAERDQLRAMFDGRCAYCGVELAAKGWHADHVKAVHYDLDYIRGGYDEHGHYTPNRMIKNGKVLRPENDTKENLFPACRACNIDKGCEPLEEWRAWLQKGMVESMRRNIPNFRHAERFGRINVIATPLVFWFERWREQQAVSKTGVDKKPNSTQVS